MKLFNLLSTTFAVLILSACGSQVAQQASTSSSSSSSSSSTSGTQTSATGNIYNLAEAPEFTAQINGAGGLVPSVSTTLATSRTLKVKVTPLSAPNLNLPGYTNWVFPYGCIRLQVKVNGTTQTTQILRVDGVSQSSTSACASAPTYQVLDFTNAMTGNGSVTVTVSNAEYDNCRYTWPMNYGCSMSAIYKTHLVAATIATQVDNTYMSP